MKTQDKILLIKSLRRELKKDWTVPSCKDGLSWGCWSCYSVMVDNFLKDWLEGLKDDLKHERN